MLHLSIVNDFFVAAVVQGITEALPISSSMHLDLVGATDTKALHVVTGITGIIYLVLNKSLKAELRHFIYMTRELIRSHFDIRWFIALIALFVVLQINFRFLYVIYTIMQANKIPLCILNVVIILFADQCKNKFKPEAIAYVSALCNLAAIIPGFSRLGTVYAGLRYIGLSPKEAFRMSMIQGIFISSIGIILSWTKTFSDFALLPCVVCGLLYYFSISILLKLDSKHISSVIFFSCIYRIFLAIYVMRM